MSARSRGASAALLPPERATVTGPRSPTRTAGLVAAGLGSLERPNSKLACWW